MMFVHWQTRCCCIIYFQELMPVVYLAKPIYSYIYRIMRRLILSLICLCVYFSGTAQTFLGLNGDVNSVTQIRDNPAFAVHEDRAQINFLTVGAEIGSNAIFFKRGIYNSFFTGKATMDKDYYRSYDKHSKTMWGNMEVIGPGASVLVKKRYFVAVTTGMRYLMNADNLDDNVYRLMGVNATRDTNLVDSYKVKNFAITSQIYSELNLTYAGFLYQSEDHTLVAGATLKVLNGIGAAGLGIDNATFKTYNNDGVAHNVTGTANIAMTPYANKWAISSNPYSALRNPANNMSLGADFGLVYYMNPNETLFRRKGYISRLAISITDIGSNSYTASSVSGKYAVNNKNIDFKHIQNDNNVSFGTRIFNDYLVDTTATPTGSSKKVKFGLPTALHINGDFKIEEHFWVNGNVLINLRKVNANELSNHYISTLTVTPRYVWGKFAVSVPFSFNMQKQGYLGVILFAGPVYVGSGSLFQMTVSNSINNLNLFVGSSLRIKAKRQKERDAMMM